MPAGESLTLRTPERRYNPSLVESELKRISLSAEFVRSERMMDLLRFLADRTLADDNTGLSERAIGRAVFGREENWEPRLDTIVRTEIRRLRAKLDSYYAGAGEQDPLRIGLPKGSYALTFLERVTEQTPQQFAPAPDGLLRPRHRRWSLLAVLAVLAGILCVALVLRQRHSPPESETAFRILPFASEAGPELNPSVSPDGKQIVYTWNGGAGTHIYRKSLETRQMERLTNDAAEDLYPAWSPDGSAIAFVRVTGGLKSIIVKSLRDGGERTITRISIGDGNWAGDPSPLLGDPGPVWTADGRSLLVTDVDTTARPIFQVSVETGERRPITRPNGNGYDFCPRVSPDGAKLAFARYVSHGVADIFVQDLKTGTSTQLTAERRTIRGLAWGPRGQSLIFSSNRTGTFQLWTIRPEPSEPHILTTNASSATQPATPQHADWVAYVESSETWSIWRARVDGLGPKEPVKFISSSGRNYDAAFSPDGASVSFMSDRSGSWELWVCDRDGANPRQLTHFDGPFLGGANWSPDGREIVFDGRPQGHSSIFAIAVAGGEPQAIDPTPFEQRMPAWSADGRFLYFNSNRDGSVAIWKLARNAGAQAKRISPAGFFKAEESWDGKELFLSTTSGQLWRANPDGSGMTLLTGIPKLGPVMGWSLSQRGLFYSTDNGDGAYAIYYPGKPSSGVLRRNLVRNTPALGASADGRWLLLSEHDRTEGDIRIRKPDHGT